MALADDIEHYGNAVDNGALTRGEAARQLAEVSNGGLTEMGAATAIDGWKNARATYEAEGRRAGINWARANGIDV